MKGAYDKGIPIIGIGFQDSEKNVIKFAEELTMPWPVVFDDGTKIGKTYGVSFGAGTVFIDKYGIISGMLVAGFTEEDMNGKIKPMVEATPPAVQAE